MQNGPYFNNNNDILSLLGLMFPSGGTAVTPRRLWVTDGPVYATALSGKILYIGGSFTYVYPNAQYGAPLDQSSGQYLAGAGRTIINGPVLASMPDGRGGWYIGGSFTSVNNQTRNYAARINADGSLHPWNPDIAPLGSTIYAMAASGGTVYLGGTFTTVNITSGPAPRENIAAVDADTGTVTSWQMNTNAAVGNVVNTIIIHNGAVYFGGVFGAINGIPRNNAAAATVAGSLTAWDPNVDAAVLALAAYSNKIYIGGTFTQINGGTLRNYFAQVDDAVGADFGWDPLVNSTVRALALSGSMLYIGGDFTNILGNGRNNIAAMDASTDFLDLSWQPFPAPGGMINAIAVTGNAVYFAGNFNTVNPGANPRRGLAAVDIANNSNAGAVRPWNPNPDMASIMRTIAVSGGTVYVGGFFNAISRVYHSGCAALDITTGKPTAFKANASGNVYAIHVSGNRVYIGGTFNSVMDQGGSHMQNFIAACDPTTGDVAAWDPGLAGAGGVNAIVSSPGAVYLGGNFTCGAAQNVAAISSASPATLLWTAPAQPNAAVLAILHSGGRLYIGGQFNSFGGTRDYIAAVQTIDGTIDGTFNPINPSGTVQSLALSGSALYFSGTFTNYNASTYSNLSAVDAATGADLSWGATADNPVLALSLSSGGMIYAGGSFTTLCGTVPNYLGEVGLAIPAVKTAAFAPAISGGVIYTLASSPRALYAGGNFSAAGSPPDSWTGIVALDPKTGKPLQ